jgi:hypothetical protein
MIECLTSNARANLDGHHSSFTLFLSFLHLSCHFFLRSEDKTLLLEIQTSDWHLERFLEGGQKPPASMISWMELRLLRG